MRSTINRNDPDVARGTESNSGAIANYHGFYREYSIQNHLGTELWAVDYQGNKFEIPIDPTPEVMRRVKIRMRNTMGKRSFNTAGADITQAPIYRCFIDIAVLSDGPIYVNEVDLVLCTREYLDTVHHPASVAYREQMDMMIHNALTDRSSSSPLTIIANDPSGAVKHLYVIINDVVCAVDVTNFSGPYETDRITVAERSIVANGSVTFRRESTTFEKIHECGNLVWELNGTWFSTSRQALIDHLAHQKRSMMDEAVPIDTHLDAVKEARAVQDRILKEARDEIKALKELLSIKEATIKRLRDAEFDRRNVDVEIGKLELEENRLRYSERDAIRKHHEEKRQEKDKRKTAFIKIADDAIKVIGVIAKAVVIVTPICIALYKLLKTAKA